MRNAARGLSRARHETGDAPPALVVGAVKNMVYRFIPPRLQEGTTILATRGS